METLTFLERNAQSQQGESNWFLFCFWFFSRKMHLVRLLVLTAQLLVGP